MTKTAKTNHISVSVLVSEKNAYKYLSDPRNFPEWASGLCKSISHISGDTWLVDSPMGNVKVRFSEENEFGVLDHFVELENGQIVYNPMRIISNLEGSEIIFTLAQLPGMTDEKFLEDSNWVRKDLGELKKLLETKFGQ